DSINVNADGVLYSPRISAGKSRNDGDATLSCLFEDGAIALLQAFFRDHQAAQLILAIGIGPADVEKHLRLELFEGFDYRREKNSQILAVLHSIVQVQIHSGRRLIPGIVALLMDGKGENTRVLRKDRGGSVAVMHVGVDYDGFANCPIRLHSPN